MKTTFELLRILFARTVTGPVVAVVGTVATICVLLQLVMEVAAVPLKLRVLLPCAEPKPVPPIVTDVPVAPALGERLVTTGTGAAAPAVTETLSNVAVAKLVVRALFTASPKYGFNRFVSRDALSRG